MTLVVDASVVVKWLLNDPERQSETEKATRLMRRIAEGHESVIQPVHWLVEVAAVLARISDQTVAKDLAMLQALELPVADAPAILDRACQLSIDLQQHLFDTLYHAVALEAPEATLITADKKYLASGAELGSIEGLADWSPG